MSSRTTFRPQVVLNAGSMAGNLTSSPTILQSLTMVSYAISWTGSTPVGTVSVEGSNDYALTAVGTVANAGTWTPLELSVNGLPSTTVTISGNTGKGIIDVVKTAIYAVRLIYTAGSGTGSLTAVINGKVA